MKLQSLPQRLIELLLVVTIDVSEPVVESSRADAWTMPKIEEFRDIGDLGGCGDHSRSPGGA